MKYSIMKSSIAKQRCQMNFLQKYGNAILDFEKRMHHSSVIVHEIGGIGRKGRICRMGTMGAKGR